MTNTWYVLAQDVLRDDLSVGVYYWYRVEDPPPTSYFFVEAFDDILFIDVFNGFKFVAAVSFGFFSIFALLILHSLS